MNLLVEAAVALTLSFITWLGYRTLADLDRLAGTATRHRDGARPHRPVYAPGGPGRSALRLVPGGPTGV